jgi:hypothetical protein
LLIIKIKKKMKKQYVIGGLVALGALALIAWYKKPKKNKDGFYNAGGRTGLTAQRWCARRNADGSVSYMVNNFSDTCARGWVSVRSFGDRTGV